MALYHFMCKRPLLEGGRGFSQTGGREMIDKFINEISEEIIKLVKEKMEKFMDTERDVYADEHQAKKNEYCERKLLTR